jgi:hypothetical protein
VHEVLATAESVANPVIGRVRTVNPKANRDEANVGAGR